MVRQATINKVIKFLTDVKTSDTPTLIDYCKENDIDIASWRQSINKVVKDNNIVRVLYESVKKRKGSTNSDTDVDFDDVAQDTEWVRDENGLIIGYKFNIKRKVGGPLIGTLSREQMDRLCSLYSRYGADLTTAQTSLDFPEYSLDELNRIKNAFLIYKYTCPFAPHDIDEHSEEELHNIAIERKRNNLTRTLEKNQLKDAQKIYLLLVEENKKYENFINYISKVNINITGLEDIPNTPIESDIDMILNLSDVHIGAKVESHSLYENDWTEEAIHNRLAEIIKRVSNFSLDKIYLNMLGDMLDGMDNQTARRDHIMPQCMDNYAQFDVFFRQMSWFINQLSTRCNELKIHSVPNGNHTGAPEYYAVVALQNAVSNIPNVQMFVFDKFIDWFDVNGHCFVLCHGKDSTFMKKPLPLHLNPNSIVWLNNYMDRSGITAKYAPGNIHILKGDLHSAAYDSNLKFDYRNCLSLFGDSDYSQMNFNSNPRGCSYSIISGDNILNGEFKL